MEQQGVCTSELRVLKARHVDVGAGHAPASSSGTGTCRCRAALRLGLTGAPFGAARPCFLAPLEDAAPPEPPPATPPAAPAGRTTCQRPSVLQDSCSKQLRSPVRLRSVMRRGNPPSGGICGMGCKA